MNNQVKIKICGIVSEADIALLNKYRPEYAGFVLFYPKSKRNLTLDRAKQLMEQLDRAVLRVAVVVSPNVEELEQIERAGFDRIQIHGELKEEVLIKAQIPIFLACNVADRAEDIFTHVADQVGDIFMSDKIEAYVLDAKVSGSGETFDWNLIRGVDLHGKLLILAGGLNPGNVQEGIRIGRPDIVDVSSGVEYDVGGGKSPEKVQAFIAAVRETVISIKS